MQYQRDFGTKIRELANRFPAVVVTGARQTGKTTLLKALFPNHAYVSLDLPSEAERAELDPIAFLASYPSPVIIDEVQYAPQLFRYLKIHIDQARDAHGQFILSGSQKFQLMKEVSDSLAGRVAIVELETLRAHELLSHEGLTIKEDAVLITRGGFPELWKQTDLPRDDFFRAYVATYLERDVRQLINVSNLRDFERFIRLCAVGNAQLLNKTELAKNVGVSAKTISDWLSVLIASNQLCLLEPYWENVGKRIVKSPKLYFCDTGLLCFLLGIDEKTIATSPFRGPIFETYVFSELRKALMLNHPAATLWFYRDQQGREVDFLLGRGGDITLIESKWNSRVVLSDAKWMQQLADFFSAKPTLSHRVDRMMIACGSDIAYPLTEDKRIYAVNGVRVADSVFS